LIFGIFSACFQVYLPDTKTNPILVFIGYFSACLLFLGWVIGTFSGIKISHKFEFEFASKRSPLSFTVLKFLFLFGLLYSSSTKGDNGVFSILSKDKKSISISIPYNPGRTLVQYTLDTLGKLKYIYIFNRVQNKIFKINSFSKILDSLKLEKEDFPDVWGFEVLNNNLDSVLIQPSTAYYSDVRQFQLFAMVTNRTKITRSIIQDDTNTLYTHLHFQSFFEQGNYKNGKAMVSTVPRLGSSQRVVPDLLYFDLNSNQAKYFNTLNFKKYKNINTDVYSVSHSTILDNNVFVAHPISNLIHKYSWNNKLLDSKLVSSSIFSDFNLDSLINNDRFTIQGKDMSQINFEGMFSDYKGLLYRSYAPPRYLQISDYFKKAFLVFDQKLNKIKEILYFGEENIVNICRVKDQFIFINQDSSGENRIYFEFYNEVPFNGKINFSNNAQVENNYLAYFNELKLQKTSGLKFDIVLIHLTKNCPSCIEPFIEQKIKKLPKDKYRILLIDDTKYSLDDNLKKFKFNLKDKLFITDHKLWKKHFIVEFNPLLFKFQEGGLMKEKLNPRTMEFIQF